MSLVGQDEVPAATPPVDAARVGDAPRLRRHDGAPAGAHAASRLAIVVDGLTERFRIPSERPPGLKDRLYRFRRAKYATFEALKDVSLQVRHGECVGLVGHNGSGKSTLLKCLAGILPADEGTVTVNGRMSTLLELGAGFHPDLSGRENVYLNGAILGLTRKQVDARFDEIVDFSGVRAFIDNPVRNYSSGMYVRLGFAVAVHVDPDVLLVDEVLSVGDAEFQERSLARMRSYRDRGKTVVLVSHDLGAVEALCERVVVLHRGRLVFDGPTGEGIEFYDELIHGRRPPPTLPEAAEPVITTPAPEPEPAAHDDGTQRQGTAQARFRRVRLLVEGEEWDLARPVPSGTRVQVHASFTSRLDLELAGALAIGLTVRRPDMQLFVYETRTSWRGAYVAPPAPGATAAVTFTLDLDVLSGTYLVDLLLADAGSPAIHDRWPAALEVVVESPEHEFGVAALGARIGIWNPEARWPAELHAPPPERGGPRSAQLREGSPSPGYEPEVPRLDADARPAT